MTSVLREYKDAASRQSSLHWEVLGASILRTPELSLLKQELIDSLEEMQPHSMDEDETYASSSSTRETEQTHATVVKQSTLLDVFERFAERLVESLTEQLTKLRVSLSESQQSERRLTQTKKQQEQLHELQRQ